MSQQPDTFWNDPSDIYNFFYTDIQRDIFKMPEIDVYTIVTADSPGLLARRVRYFLHLNPKWIISGGMVISSGTKDFRYTNNNSEQNYITVRDHIYHQTLIKPPPHTPATGGSIRQNSRKIRVQRKKRD